HHLRSFIQFDHCNGVGGLEPGRRQVGNDVAVKRSSPTGPDHFHMPGRARGTEGPGREVGIAAVAAGLQPNFTDARAFPEMGGFGRGYGQGAVGGQRGRTSQAGLPAISSAWSYVSTVSPRWFFVVMVIATIPRPGLFDSRALVAG